MKKKKVKLRKDRILIAALLLAIIICLIVCIFCFIFSNKQQNKLKCTSDNIINNDTYKTEYNLKFKKDKLTNVEYLTSVTLSTKNLEYLNLYYSTFLETFSEYENDKNIKIDTDKDDKGYYVKLNFDLNKYNGNTNLFNKTLNYKESKSYYEMLGYTCR